MRNRPAALLAALALSGLLGVATTGPAAAHGDTIHLDITAPANGHPKTVATWENDGDPVTESLAATLSAMSSDGRSVGPWPLIAVPGSASTYTTREALPAGQWKVTVESGFPALGRGEAEVTVSAASAGPAGPTATAATPPAASPATRSAVSPVASSSASSAASSTTGGWSTVGWITAGVGLVAAVVVVVGGPVAARRFRRTS